jgi:predicted membrane protein
MFTNTMKGKAKLLMAMNKELLRLKESAHQINMANMHKDFFGDGHKKDVERQREAIAFVEVDREVALDLSGSIFSVGAKFLVAPRSRKWRVRGKGTWYLYKNPEQFIKKYVLKEADWQ